MFNFLIARSLVSQPWQRKSHLDFLYRNAFHIFNYFSSVVKSSESAKPKQKREGHESFTVSYLMNSCGLSAKLAFEVSKKVRLKDPDNSTRILHIFQSYGFSNSQISEIVKKHPPVLLTHEKRLLPKLKFLESIGFSRSELPELLIYNIRMLVWSLQNRIIPGYEGLKSVIGDDHEMRKIISKRKGWHFLHFDVKNLSPNLKFLRELGVPKSSLNKLLTKFTCVAAVDHAKFVEHVKFVKKIGGQPSRATFIYSIHALSMTKKSTWESKLEIYKRCGWSRDETLSAFGKFPNSMLISEEKITSTIKFLTDEMGLSPNDIVRSPAYLGYSLKNRIIPRSSVFKVLRKKGLIDNDMHLFSLVRVSETIFLEKFVFRFQESAPELLNIYLDQPTHSPEDLQSSSV